jgi:choice-of-anchor C domain-containing protein
MSVFRKVSIVVFLVTNIAVAESGASDNLLINGSFEQGPSTFSGPYPGSTIIPGWVVIRGQIDYYPGWQAADGSVSLDLNGSPGVGGVEQTFLTVPDQQYLVTFSMAGNPHTQQVYTMSVAAAGESADFSFDNTGYTELNMGWATKSWTFAATGTSTTLQMYSTTTATPLDGPALDNISVVAVPEPSALALLGIIAACLLGFAWQSRKMNAKAAASDFIRTVR